MLRRVLIASALSALGCAEQFPLPMTAAELASHDSGAALVAYLGQPDATPAVCDLRTRGPHLSALDAKTRTALVRGLTDGKIEPNLWRRCSSVLLKSVPRDTAASWVDAVGQGYRKLIRSSEFEKSAALQERLRVMQQFYVERKNGSDGHSNVDAKLVGGLRTALVKHGLGPVATTFGEDLVDTVDLEHGTWLGRAVDAPMIDGLYATSDEKTLRRFGNRLPSSELRDQAKRRVIRIHIAASPFLELRDRAAEIEEIVMKQGSNPISLPSHAPARGWVDTQKVPMRGVLVRQQVWQQTATLLGYSGDRPGLSVLPELKLRGALMVEVQGISRPVTLCAPSKELDPTPCVSVKDVRLENPVSYLDKGGAFHFVEHIAMRDAVSLAQMRDRFVLPVIVGGQRLTSFDWRLYYERPQDLTFSGAEPGANGPNLGVLVDHRDSARFIFTASTAGAQYLAVVEKPDAPAFHIVSRGAQGFTGATGSSGSAGSSGGDCQSGGNGGDGGPGGDGGRGGNGGEIVVRVACGDQACSDAVALLERTIFSQGGAGGAGGSGGSGGAGGSGGSGRSPTTHTDENGTTVTDDPGCSAGSNGSSGSNGSGGSPGPPGRPGRTNFSIVR